MSSSAPEHHPARERRLRVAEPALTPRLGAAPHRVDRAGEAAPPPPREPHAVGVQDDAHAGAAQVRRVAGPLGRRGSAAPARPAASTSSPIDGHGRRGPLPHAHLHEPVASRASAPRTRTPVARTRTRAVPNDSRSRLTT